MLSGIPIIWVVLSQSKIVRTKMKCDRRYIDNEQLRVQSNHCLKNFYAVFDWGWYSFDDESLGTDCSPLIPKGLLFYFILFFGRQFLYTCCTFGWSSGCLLQRTLTRFLGILLSPLFMCYSTHLNALLECFPALWSVPVQAYAFSANSAPPSYPFTVRAYVSPWICASNFDPKTLILFLFLCYAGCG